MAKILVVEDVDVVRRALERMLAGSGHEVIAKEDGTSGLAYLQEEAVDLLLSDIVMPGAIQGDDLAKHARTHRPDIGVILITGFSRKAAELDVMTSDRLEIVRKPVRKDVLLATIDRILAT